MHFNLYFQQTIPFFKLCIYMLMIRLFGILTGLALIIVAYKVYFFLMFRLFKFSPFSACDRLFVWNKLEERFNLIGLIVCDKLDINGLKRVFIERGIKKFSKMRSIPKYKYFDWWWQELTVEEVLDKYNPIEINEESNLNFKSKEDLVKHVNNELLKKFDLEKELPYKICIFRNHSESIIKNMIMIKFDHSLTDGLGMMGMITALADNYDVNLFPSSIQKSPMSLKTILLSIFTIPYVMLYPSYRHLIYLKSGETPFKSNKPNSGTPLTSLSEQYDFGTYSKISKNLGITFNDMVMSVFSAAIKKYCSLHFHRIPKMVATMTPIGNRNIPKEVEDISITNNSSGIGCELVLIDDPMKDSDIISKEFAGHVRNIPLTKSVKIMMDFMLLYMPTYLSKHLVKESQKNFDFIFSNVPGPRNHLYYSGCKVIDMIPFTTPGISQSFVSIVTYSGNFRFGICFDSVLNTNPETLLKYVSDELNLLKTSYESKTHDAKITNRDENLDKKRN